MSKKETRADFPGFMFITVGEDGGFLILSIDENKRIYLQPKSGAPDIEKTMVFWSNEPDQINKWLSELKSLTGSELDIKTEDLIPVRVNVSYQRNLIEVQ